MVGSTLDKIMDMPCDHHAPKSKKDNADKQNPPNDDDEDGPQDGASIGEQKQLPLQDKNLNMIYPCHTIKRDQKHALREV